MAKSTLGNGSIVPDGTLFHVSSEENWWVFEASTTRSTWFVTYMRKEQLPESSQAKSARRSLMFDPFWSCFIFLMLKDMNIINVGKTMP